MIYFNKLRHSVSTHNKIRSLIFKPFQLPIYNGKKIIKSIYKKKNQTFIFVMAFKVALIGYGYWGPKLARNIQNSNNFEINHIIDKSKKNLEIAKRSFPLSKVSTNFKDIDKDKIDLVVISTPTKTHYQLTKYFLKYSNVLVEKPLALKLKDVKNLEFLSKKANINYSLIILLYFLVQLII